MLGHIFGVENYFSPRSVGQEMALTSSPTAAYLLYSVPPTPFYQWCRLNRILVSLHS